jgi:hypothetical protein
VCARFLMKLIGNAVNGCCNQSDNDACRVDNSSLKQIKVERLAKGSLSLSVCVISRREKGEGEEEKKNIFFLLKKKLEK